MSFLQLEIFLYLPLDELKIVKAINELTDLSPKGIRERLNLRKPIYQPTAAYGHFGRDSTPEGLFSWEKTDLVDELKKACF